MLSKGKVNGFKIKRVYSGDKLVLMIYGDKCYSKLIRMSKVLILYCEGMRTY